MFARQSTSTLHWQLGTKAQPAVWRGTSRIPALLLSSRPSSTAAAVSLDNVQGDLFSRGFPKFNEVYYFFSIARGKEKDFTKALKRLVLDKDKHISSLTKALGDWDIVNQAATENRAIEDVTQKKIVPMSNALIAFSALGLHKIQAGITDRSLGLNDLADSDPAFSGGMALDGSTHLHDPPRSVWDSLFKVPIHGLLKVAGNSQEEVEKKLKILQEALGHGSLIKDLSGTSSPTNLPSRVDGQVRPMASRLRGHEHFGFKDGISQPLLRGVNSDEDLKADPYMETDQNIITVSKNPPGTQDGVQGNARLRPEWMVDGSFLAFRKLEQNVQEWLNLVNKHANVNCDTPEHCGAKLMGRWPSGAPIAEWPDKDAPDTTKHKNIFSFKNVKKSVCPEGAHIRKVNPRTEGDSVKMARMIRNGIPYGTEFSESTKDDKRGLLFACYQSSLENGFQFIQKDWCNAKTFPASNTGHDPLIGQAPNDGTLQTTFHHENDADISPGLGDFRRAVTMKGGEYFFVPSISALRDTLGSD